MEAGVEVRATASADAGPLGPTYRVLSLGIFAMIVVIAFEFMAVATALPVAARPRLRRLSPACCEQGYPSARAGRRRAVRRGWGGVLDMPVLHAVGLASVTGGFALGQALF